MRIKPLSFIIVAALLLSGCTAIFSTLYGVRNLKTFEPEKCEKFASYVKRENISLSAHVSDSVQFDAYRLLSPDTTWQKQTLIQPIQMLYFHHDTLVSMHINCYAPGKLTSLDWNFDNRFGEFPPKTAVPLEGNGLSYRKLQQIYQLPESLNTEYQIVIFWTNMIRRISKDAVNTALDNIEKFHREADCDVFLINNDQFFIGAE